METKDSQSLPASLTERVMERLGLPVLPETNLDGLTAIYSAWCHKVPFDNVRKIIHVAENDPGPLPGFTPEDFFQGWLDHGTGGTCWAGNGALAALLTSLGFQATHGIGTMMVVPDLPPNHGTVSVELEGKRYIVDASILHGEALPLVEGQTTSVDHPAWGVKTYERDGRRFIQWRPLMHEAALECRIEHLGSDQPEFCKSHENTRVWSPFNYELSARINRGESVLGAAFGQRVEIDEHGDMIRAPLQGDQRMRFLIDEMGYSEEISARLPQDRATPPPPWSATAAAQSGNLL